MELVSEVPLSILAPRVNAPDGIGHRDRISRRLGDIGFTIQQETSQSIQFTRGHAKGDFAIELAKVDVTVSLPLETEATVIVEYGWVCLFDTGDLWEFAKELQRSLSE